MGVRFPSQVTNAIISGLPASATETIIFTTGPLVLPYDNALVLINWSASILAGTGTTSLTYQIRRGPLLSAPSIFASSWVFTLTAGNSAVMSGFYFDSPGPATALQYSLTVVQNGATAAGTLRDGAVAAFVL